MNTWRASQLGETQSPGYQPKQYLWGCQLTVSKEPEITNGVILLLLGYPSRCLLALPARSHAPWVVYNGESCSPWAGSQEWLYLSGGGHKSLGQSRWWSWLRWAECWGAAAGWPASLPDVCWAAHGFVGWKKKTKLLLENSRENREGWQGKS